MAPNYPEAPTVTVLALRVSGMLWEDAVWDDAHGARPDGRW
ncbi:hypothetical protein [Arthrobacter sp. NPDC056493]